MPREQILKHMQDYILQLKALSNKGNIIREELRSLNEVDTKWFEDNYRKWLNENGLSQIGL